MKKIIGIILAVMIAGTLSAQIPNSLRYPLTLGMGTPGTVTGGVLNLRGLTSGSVQLKVPAIAGTGTVFQFPANNGTSGYVLKTSGAGVLTWNPAIEAGESEDITGDVIIVVSDTTVTLALGRIVYKTSNNHFYGCVRINNTGVGTRWKQLDN